MTPKTLLSQDEIEALLELVESERESRDAAPAERSEAKANFINALGQAGDVLGGDHEEVLPRDFSKPDRLPRDEFDWLQAEAQHSASRLAQTLGGWLRMDVRVECIAIETQQFHSFLLGLTSPCLVYPVQCGKDFAYRGALSIESSLVLAIVDRILGGKGRARFAARALSIIEMPMAERLGGILLKSLADGFADVLPIERAPSGSPAVEPRQARFLDADTNIIIATYSISGEIAETEMRFIIPAVAYPKKVGRVVAESAAQAPPAVPLVPVEVAVRLAGTNITIRELLNLELGDVIALDERALGFARIDIEGLEAAVARVGTRDNNYAAIIEEVLEPKERAAAAKEVAAEQGA